MNLYVFIVAKLNLDFGFEPSQVNIQWLQFFTDSFPFLFFSSFIFFLDGQINLLSIPLPFPFTMKLINCFII